MAAMSGGESAPDEMTLERVRSWWHSIGGAYWSDHCPAITSMLAQRDLEWKQTLAARDASHAAREATLKEALAMTVEVLRGVELQSSLDMRPHGVVTQALHAGRRALAAPGTPGREGT